MKWKALVEIIQKENNSFYKEYFEEAEQKRIQALADFVF